MCFHTALRTTHCRRGFSGVKFLPITQQKGFSLTPGQGCDLVFDRQEGLAALGGTLSALDKLQFLGCRQDRKQVKVMIVISGGLEIAEV